MSNPVATRLKLLPILPRKVTCRICKKKFNNPLREGSSIVIITCPECRAGFLKNKRR